MIPFYLLTRKKTAWCGVLGCAVFRRSELSLLPAAAAANGTGLGDRHQGRATQEELAVPHQSRCPQARPAGSPTGQGFNPGRVGHGNSLEFLGILARRLKGLLAWLLFWTRHEPERTARTVFLKTRCFKRSSVSGSGEEGEADGPRVLEWGPDGRLPTPLPFGRAPTGPPKSCDRAPHQL